MEVSQRTHGSGVLFTFMCKVQYKEVARRLHQAKNEVNFNARALIDDSVWRGKTDNQ